MGTKKVKVYGKVKLYEASAVGIPAYADAVFGKSFSLVKSLGEDTSNLAGNIQLNLKKETMTQETEKSETVAEIVKEAEMPVAEKAAVVEVEKTIQVTEKQVAEMIAKALKEASVERGLISEETVKDLKTKSMGELAVEAGFFQLTN